MNVYFSSPRNSHAIDRVVDALRKYMPPEVVQVAYPDDADLVVMHVTGRLVHTTEEAQAILGRKKSYAVIQYTVKSTRNPDPNEWLPLWENATVVWSYLDLPAKNFYHAPLAADPAIFFPENTEKKYLVGTLGNAGSFGVECFGEVHLAAFQVQGRVAHVGEGIGANPIVDYVSGSDDTLRQVYNQCRYFAALRRKEGFEMPAVESLLCGVRPILFDTPNYREWFDGLATFIAETNPQDTVHQLRTIFKKNHAPVTQDEIKETKRRFNWKTSAEGFWERCMN